MVFVWHCQANGEQHWHRIGDVALLFLDTLAGRIAPDGDLRPENVRGFTLFCCALTLLVCFPVPAMLLYCIPVVCTWRHSGVLSCACLVICLDCSVLSSARPRCLLCFLHAFYLQPLFGPQQWRLINEALSDAAVNWMVVVSSTPLVDGSAPTSPLMNSGGYCG